MKTVSERLAYIMDMKQVTQTQLATRAGVSQPTIWKIINGRSKKSRELPAIAQALGVNFAWLVNGTEPITGRENGEAEALDQSKIVPVYDVNGKTGDVITSPVTRSEPDWRAYIMDRDGMVNVAPVGSIVVIDTSKVPGMNDYVVVERHQRVSVWRFKEGVEPDTCLLQSDDPAIPSVNAPLSSVIGPVLFIVNEFRRL